MGALERVSWDPIQCPSLSLQCFASKEINLESNQIHPLYKFFRCILHACCNKPWIKWHMHIRHLWIDLLQPLKTKTQIYRDCCLQLAEDVFIKRPRHMDTYLSHTMWSTIGQIKVSSHTLEIEACPAAQPRGSKLPKEAQICMLCQEVELEEHYVCTS